MNENQAARRMSFTFDVDVPSDCPLDDQEIIRALNDCLAIAVLDAIETVQLGDVDSSDAEAIAGMTFYEISPVKSVGAQWLTLDSAARPARSIPFIGRVDVPAGCPLNDAEILATLNDSLVAHAASLERFTDAGPLGIHRLNAILSDDELRATVSRYCRGDYLPGPIGERQKNLDKETLTAAFIGLGVV